jgi:hypothetical protein
MMAVNPQETWHRFHAPEGVTLMMVTPFPSEVIETMSTIPAWSRRGKMR